MEGRDTGDDQTLREKTRGGMGVAVSTMVCPDEHLSDGDKTIFHWCQEGSIGKVKDLLISGGHIVNQLDSQVTYYSQAHEEIIVSVVSLADLPRP